MTSRLKLACCPICGKRPWVIHEPDGYWYVGCTLECDIASEWDPVRSVAVEKWNEARRTASAIAHRQRCRRVADAINHQYNDADLQTNIVDLLSDLQHLCLNRRVAWEDVLRISSQHFSAEDPRKVRRSPQERNRHFER